MGRSLQGHKQSSCRGQGPAHTLQSITTCKHLAEGRGRAYTLPSVNRERLMLDASLSMSLLVLVSFTRSLPACQNTRVVSN